MQMGRVNPNQWWNGNQLVAEVYKCVNASPMEKAILIMLCASIHEPKEKTKQKEIFIVFTINKIYFIVSKYQGRRETS